MPPSPRCVLAAVNQLRTHSLSPSHGSVGRVPSPGACTEDTQRAADRKFIVAKHPLCRWSVLHAAREAAKAAKKGGARPFVPGNLSREPVSTTSSDGVTHLLPRRRISSQAIHFTCYYLRAFASSREPIPSPSRQPYTRGRSLCFAQRRRGAEQAKVKRRQDPNHHHQQLNQGEAAGIRSPAPLKACAKQCPTLTAHTPTSGRVVHPRATQTRLRFLSPRTPATIGPGFPVQRPTLTACSTTLQPN
jgi:hypothetical protein